MTVMGPILERLRRAATWNTGPMTVSSRHPPPNAPGRGCVSGTHWGGKGGARASHLEDHRHHDD
ncbi:hypothetical protein DSL92_07275 [Billgrantia gudaonensis]|uniref:Uncharacterized protein n=1 Tax=Billgrantia gudaonensis TaxID=376427 RepID=A0A3S0Q0Y9_9GAMM|nr:hypothetical protein DSL92_07275 [Halomonas gudaonensis]